MSLKRPSINNKVVLPLVPYELYYYFPKETDLFQESKYIKSQYKRLIFEGNQRFSPFEQLKLSKCKEEASKLVLPSTWRTSDTLRFLYANNLNIKRTVKAMLLFLKKDGQCSFIHKPHVELIEIINSGAFYIKGRDYRFRPIIHFSIFKLERIRRKHSSDDLTKSVILLIEYVVKYLLLPGQIESWDIIIDVGNSTSDLGEELKEVFKLFKAAYPCRLFKLFIVNVKGVNALTWSFVKLLIEQETMSQVMLIKDNERKSYFDYINPYQLEEKYGGLKPDLSDHYFPPDFSKDDISSYLLPFEKKAALLLSPEDYQRKMSNEGLFYNLPPNYQDNHISGDNSSNRQISTSQAVSIKDLLDKTISSTPQLKMDAHSDINSHNSNIFPIESQQSQVILKRNSSITNHKSNSKALSLTETKMNDITLDSHSSSCSYICGSAAPDSNCHIF